MNLIQKGHRHSHRGIIGVESAIVLIAFVIVAAALAFVVLNMGFSTTQKAKTTIVSTLQQAGSSLEVEGKVIGSSFTPGSPFESALNATSIPIKISGGGDSVNLDPSVTAIKYLSNQITYDNIYAGTLQSAGVFSSLETATAGALTAGFINVDPYADAGWPRETTAFIYWTVSSNTNEILEAGEHANIAIVFARGDLPQELDTFRAELIISAGAALTVERQIPNITTEVVGPRIKGKGVLMNPPRILFSLSFLSQLNQLTESFRIFLVASVISIYGLVLYEGFPELILNANNSISFFVLPMALLAGVTIGLPRAMPIIMEKIFKKSITKSKQPGISNQSDDILDQIVTEGSSQQLVEPTSTDYVGGETGTSSEFSNKELDDIISGVVKESKNDDNTVGLDPTSLGEGKDSTVLGESKVRDLVDQKFEPVEKDLSSFKKDLNKIKEDMKTTKDSVDTLTESFEGTLTDMKAFQAEISNPLNFMRKYFESLDLKLLQDPSLPLRHQLIDNSVPTTEPYREKETIMIPSGAQTGQKIEASPSQLSLTKDSDQSGKQVSDSPNPMDSVLKPLFSGSLSVGKMMSIVELAGDMLKEQGDDCIDLLIEQCKLMGLKPEDENSIYNIIDMLKNSGMNVEDSLIQLYKFSKIVGLTDPEADSHYSKLMANRARKKLGKGE